MRIALFSDIHANLPALQAVLQDIEQKKADQVYCLGDLVGYAPWPNEVVREIRQRMIPTIAGNYDHGVGRNSDDCGCAYKTEEEKSNGQRSIAYTNEVIGNEERKYLRDLPAHIRLEFELKENVKMDLLLVHGSPRKVNEYLFEDREEKSMLRIMESANADIMVCGHTHKPYHRIIQKDTDGLTRYRHAVNIGSVGKPKDKDPRACYAIIELNENSNVFEKDTVKVEFIRVAYDVEKAAREIEKSVLPDEFAKVLRSGG